jgi:hypothetical protein
MKKIAICISGQFRTFDKIWEENIKVLKKNKTYEYYFFCFFWKNKGDTQRILPGHNRTLKNLFLDPFYYYAVKNNKKVNLKEVKKIIPKAEIKISKICERKIIYLDKFLKLIKNYPHNKNDVFNSFCLWKSIQICDKMRINYQRKNKIKYDCVMRIRPDWKLKKNPLDEFFKRKDNIIFFDSSTIKTKKKCYASVTDVCFISKPKEMNMVSNLYPSWIKEIKKRGWVEYSFGAKVHNYKLVFEAALYWFLKSKKIKILTNTLGGYGFIYRSFYENKYLKRTFSMTLLLIQIKEIPKKIFNSIF